MKVVLAGKHDYRADPSQGGGQKVFGEGATPEIRRQFAGEVLQVRTAFFSSFREHSQLPAVAKVELIPEASAKSHRPHRLFNEQTCPIIGLDEPGELLVSVNRRGLDSLSHEIEMGSTKEHEANISTLQRISPFRAEDALEGESPREIANEAKRRKLPVRVRLFRHPSNSLNEQIDQEAKEIANRNKVERVEVIDYGDDVSVLAMHGASPEAIQAMAGFVGTQSVGLFPDFRIVRTAAHVVGAVDDKRFPVFDPNGVYGLVGVIDSGTDRNNAKLQTYVVSREDWVRDHQNNDHGSFVAGLIANARALNSGNDRFPSARSQIVDIVALDSTGRISEYDLITVIDRAVRKYKQVRVWNISLGQDTPCKDNRFSLLACKLDSIGKKRGVLFVIAAGNYDTRPLRKWPPTDLGEADRIGPPADSIRSLTVGSLAHISNATSCVRVDEPSGFSRRGPAPHFYLKPEISHYGGNCDDTGDCLQTGVVSTDGAGNLAENIGTSFAAPCVSTLAANVFRELHQEQNVSPTFVKGLLVHSAFTRSGAQRVRDIRYRGFGSPGDLSDILNCTQSEATVIFHAELTDRHFFEKFDFPMPKCLIVPGKGLRAEVFMTLIYDPPTDARFGIEYCRTNITASLGTLGHDKDGKEKWTRQIEPAPKGITTGCEAGLVAEGFKWAPLKFYYRNFERGQVGKKWRLHLEILNRDGFRCKEPQPITLFVTIRDPEGKAEVYDTMIREMERLAWGAVDLKVASRVRASGRGKS